MLRVRNAMNRDVITASSEDTLDTAWRTMQEGQISHLVVVDGETAVGVISEGDVMLQASVESNGDISVPPIPLSNVMSERLITCSPAHSLTDVAATMITCKIGCVPVLQDGKLVGIVSTSDLLDKMCEQDELMGYRVMPLDHGVRSHATIQATRSGATRNGAFWGGAVYADGWREEPDENRAALDVERTLRHELDDEFGASDEEDENFREDESVHWT